MKPVSVEQERAFQKNSVLARREHYLSTNPLQRYDDDPPYRAKIEHVRSALHPPSGWVLDIGGNTAGEATVLQSLGYRFIVGDINEFALAISKQRAQKFGLPVPAYVALDAQHLPFTAGFFDQVTIIHALHHFVDYTPVLDEVYRVLKPGGRLVSLEPFARNPIRRASEVRDRFRGTIEKSFTIGQLRTLLEKSRFESIYIRCVPVGRSRSTLEQVPIFRRWFARLHGWLNAHFPRLFGDLLIVAEKPGAWTPVDPLPGMREGLRCPVTGEVLLQGQDGWTNSGRSHRYAVVEGIPVLIAADAIACER